MNRWLLRHGMPIGLVLILSGMTLNVYGTVRSSRKRDAQAARIAELEKQLAVKPAPPVDTRPFTAALKACAERTEWLHKTMDVLLHESACWASDRIKWPNPPPGWQPWPDTTAPEGSWRELTRNAEKQ